MLENRTVQTLKRSKEVASRATKAKKKLSLRDRLLAAVCFARAEAESGSGGISRAPRQPALVAYTMPLRGEGDQNQSVVTGGAADAPSAAPSPVTDAGTFQAKATRLQPGEIMGDRAGSRDRSTVQARSSNSGLTSTLGHPHVRDVDIDKTGTPLYVPQIVRICICVYTMSRSAFV
jgi:hypothetical protein